MSITKYQPRNQFVGLEPDSFISQFRSEMDRFVDSFLGGQLSLPAETRWTPRASVDENEKEFIITVDLPGVDQKNVLVEVAGRILSIRATRDSESQEGNGKKNSRVERFGGSFQQSLSLPDTVDADQLNGELKQGVLTLRLPKIPAAQPKAIPISKKD